MDKKSLLIIVILILISSQLWNILWDIGKSALYIVILLLALTYLSPDIAEEFRTVLKKIINLDYSLISNSLSYISGFLLAAFGKLPKNIKNLIQEEYNTNEETIRIGQTTRSKEETKGREEQRRSKEESKGREEQRRSKEESKGRKEQKVTKEEIKRINQKKRQK